MGYETGFDGTIKMKDKYAVKLLNYLQKKRKIDVLDMGVTIEGDRVIINDSWKNYHEEMEKFCMLIVSLDPKAEGEIECNGEDKEDLWKLVISKGKILKMTGSITYEDDRYVEYDDDVQKEAEEFLTDKKIKEEILIEAI